MANIEYDIRGLQCDNPKCDWVDMSIPVTDYDKWVNGKCPKCGEIVLTQNDYNQTQKLLQSIKMVNNLSEDTLANLTDNLSPEDINRGLDWMNDMGLKKVGEDESEETWKVIHDKKKQ